jgi:hypothetical protein
MDAAPPSCDPSATSRRDQRRHHVVPVSRRRFDDVPQRNDAGNSRRPQHAGHGRPPAATPLRQIPATCGAFVVARPAPARVSRYRLRWYGGGRRFESVRGLSTSDEPPATSRFCPPLPTPWSTSSLPRGSADRRATGETKNTANAQSLERQLLIARSGDTFWGTDSVRSRALARVNRQGERPRQPHLHGRRRSPKSASSRGLLSENRSHGALSLFVLALFALASTRVAVRVFTRSATSWQTDAGLLCTRTAQEVAVEAPRVLQTRLSRVRARKGTRATCRPPRHRVRYSALRRRRAARSSAILTRREQSTL